MEGFEGPLDLLLALARQQKVDLAQNLHPGARRPVPLLYRAGRDRLELAADYLVMAAWLAYLKSRLLLPEPAAPEGTSAADMARALALRLRRLDAIACRGRKTVRASVAAAATCSVAAIRSRSPKSSGRNGRRRFTT